MANTEALAEAPLAEADLAGACALVAEAGWNQNAADWRVFLELGSTIGLKNKDLLVATAATLPYPSGFGWISMVLVTGAFRRQGIATRLLEKCISRLLDAGMVPVLDATPAGRLGPASKALSGAASERAREIPGACEIAPPSR